MTVVRYNQESCEYELLDGRTGAVLESGYDDLQAAKSVAATYNADED